MHWSLAIHAFVETSQGHYKDGTNGTKDYRAVSGLHFNFLQIIIIACYMPKLDNHFFLLYSNVSGKYFISKLKINVKVPLT